MRPVLAGVLALSVVAAGCSDVDDAVDAVVAEEPSVTTIVDGRLTACVVQGPGIAEQGDAGLAGYDVAVLEAVAADLGLPLDLVPSALDDVVSGVSLNSGTCDVAAGGVVDRAALDEVVTTSAPYRTVHRQLVATVAGPEVEPGTVAGRVGVEEGGPAAVDAVSLPEADVVPFPSRADLGRALQQGLVDLALVTVTDRAALEEQFGAELALRGVVPTDETTVLLLPLAAPEDLAEAVDAALADLEASGELTELAGTWLRS